MSPINAYIICFRQDKARRKMLRERFGKIGIKPKFIDAIRGADLSDRDKASFNTRKRQTRHGHMMQDSAIGCALSHHRAWQSIIDSDAHCGFVFEDDAIAQTKDLKPLMEELVSLAGYLDIVTLTNQREKLKRERVRSCGTASALYMLRGNDFGAVSYFITADAAKRLLSHPLLHQYEVDFLMHHWWNHDCQLLHLLPPLFAEDGRPSTIGHENNIPWPNDSSWVRCLRRFNRFVDSVRKRALFAARLRHIRTRLQQS
jgi:glycosyl transferase family 25